MNDTTSLGVCDCYRYNGCTGPTCSDPSGTVMAFASITTLIAGLMAVPIIVGGIHALWKLKQAGKLGSGPVTKCFFCTTLSASFGWAYMLENSVRKSFQCSHSDNASGHITGPFASIFAMFYILGIVNIALMWIDVWVKSKTMQKVEAGNSLVNKYKMYLRVFSIGFGVLGVLTYSIEVTLFIALTFLVGIGLLIIW